MKYYVVLIVWYKLGGNTYNTIFLFPEGIHNTQCKND